MAAILSGEATDAQIAGFAVALRAKGETAAELAALVRTCCATRSASTSRESTGPSSTRAAPAVTAPAP